MAKRIEDYDVKADVMRVVVDNLQQEYHASFMDDYSGRFMYGDTSPAISVDGASPVEVGMLMAMAAFELGKEDDLYDGVLLSKSVASDDLGMGMVVYYLS